MKDLVRNGIKVDVSGPHGKAWKLIVATSAIRGTKENRERPDDSLAAQCVFRSVESSRLFTEKLMHIPNLR